jgi:hypothetical protein
VEEHHFSHFFEFESILQIDGVDEVGEVHGPQYFHQVLFSIDGICFG